jgi:hypothetical protein
VHHHQKRTTSLPPKPSSRPDPNDLIDFLILHKERRREALRLLGEIKAAEQ